MAITLAQLRARTQTLFDTAGSALLTPAEWNELINDGIRALWTDVVSVNKDFRVSSQAFTISTTVTPFTSLSALTGGFREVRSVIRDFGLHTQEYLNRFTGRIGSSQYERSYRLQGTSLYIEPQNRALGSYTLLFIPGAPVLAADGDVFDAELEQFQDYPILHAVVMALSREESDITQFAAQLGGAKERVRTWAADQRSADPDVVEDVRGYTSWGGLP